MSRELFASRPALRLRLFRTAFALGHSLPYRLGMMIAIIIGLAAWLIDGQGRSRVRRNLRPMLASSGLAHVERSVRRSFVHCLMMFNEAFRLARLPGWLVSPQNIQIVDPWGVFAQPPLKGPAILCTIHCNWELLLAAGHHLGLIESIRVISRSNLDPAIDELFDRMRASHSARSLLLERAPLASLRALRDQRLLGIVADRDYSGNGMVLPLAGHQVSLPVGPAALAVQSGAPIIPVLLARRGTSGFALLVAKPILPHPELSKAEQLPILMHQLARVMDRFIHAVPSQWMAFHDVGGRSDPPI
ncbi:MAG: hypothetical protein EA402_11140 [Planctomycetota bacterium]|nr:MAG: hypothetical protein EA402_11140 [Planctomycetota bacterium]